jgi:Phosphotransferase System HPr (HPr) Family
MVTVTTKVINKLGIHARPASNLTLKAKEFESEITIKNLSAKNPIPVNAKSIMKILVASITTGSLVEISAEGKDEQKAVDELITLFEEGFSEE